MILDYFPPRLIADKLSEGWRTLSGHEYNTADWAILLTWPDTPQPITPAAIRSTAARFRPRPVRSNMSAAATSRMVTRPRRVRV